MFIVIRALFTRTTHTCLHALMDFYYHHFTTTDDDWGHLHLYKSAPLLRHRPWELRRHFCTWLTVHFWFVPESRKSHKGERTKITFHMFTLECTPQPSIENCTLYSTVIVVVYPARQREKETRIDHKSHTRNIKKRFFGCQLRKSFGRNDWPQPLVHKAFHKSQSY
jgi:hypothetical protein